MQQLHKQPARAPGPRVGTENIWVSVVTLNRVPGSRPAGGAAALEAWACGRGAAGERRAGAEAPGPARAAARPGRPSPAVSPHGQERAAAAAAALTGPGQGWRADGPRRRPGAEGKMSALLEQKEQQERLREAAALGDIREVQKLVESGVDVNSQNEVNGW